MEIPLQMVGVHQHVNDTFKGVQFVDGRGIVIGVDELVGNVCKYLKTLGAFPLAEAEERQAAMDLEAGRVGDMRGLRTRLEKAEAEVTKIRAQIEERLVAADEMLAKQQKDEDGPVQANETPQGRSSKSSGHSKNPKSRATVGQ
jgi:hypothetical protein